MGGAGAWPRELVPDDAVVRDDELADTPTLDFVGDLRHHHDSES
jgi:hypothetical protein